MYEQITQALDQCANPIKATNKQKSFQTHVGGYGEGDTFIGLTVPQTRSIAKQFQSADTTTLTTLTTLLNSPIHEYRECALYMMADYQYPKSNDQKKQLLFELYTNNLEAVNNWDLVDASAHKIIGRHLLQRNRSPLYKLAQTDHLWKQRIAMVATWWFIRNDDIDETFALAKVLINHTHDLIHKATGWMLREAGKKDIQKLYSFLDTHAATMPRTMLRYSLEKIETKKRKHYMNLHKARNMCAA